MYLQDSKLFKLYNQIKQINKLKHLLIDDVNTSYIHDHHFTKGLTHIHKCILQTKKYPFINEYIEQYLTLNPKEINVKSDAIEYTALIFASANSLKYCTDETVEILLKHKPNIDVQDKFGRTTLMHAVQNTKLYSSEGTVKILLKYGANVNVQCDNGHTALMYDTMFLKKNIKILLEYGSDVNIQNKFGKTALMYACQYLKKENLNETVKILLKCGTNINCQDNNGYTAIMYAIKYLNAEKTIKLLVKNKANIQHKTKINENAVTFAFKNLKHTAKIIEIINPNRKIFIEGTTRLTKYLPLKLIDFNVVYITIRNYIDIINFL